MKSNHCLKSEFRRRLVHLSKAIDEALESGTVHRSLMPALFSVYTYLWCKCSDDLERQK